MKRKLLFVAVYLYAALAYPILVVRERIAYSAAQWAARRIRQGR